MEARERHWFRLSLGADAAVSFSVTPDPLSNNNNDSTIHKGVPTVAVFSDADASAPHVSLADEAVRLGPAAPSQSYLDADRILAAARASGATAVHPGYGFLSESAPFAEKIVQSGLTWVGPPPAAMRSMGDKARAKELMSEAGVPVVPGYHGEDQSDER